MYRKFLMSVLTFLHYPWIIEIIEYQWTFYISSLLIRIENLVLLLMLRFKNAKKNVQNQRVTLRLEFGRDLSSIQTLYKIHPWVFIFRIQFLRLTPESTRVYCRRQTFMDQKTVTTSSLNNLICDTSCKGGEWGGSMGRYQTASIGTKTA